MNESDVFRIKHVLEAAKETLVFAKERNRKDLDTDRGFMLILVKEIEIIGEAAANVSEETRSQLSEIDWRAIVNMRNRMVHVYFDINLDILWLTITNDIPDLIATLEKIPFINE